MGQTFAIRLHQLVASPTVSLERNKPPLRCLWSDLDDVSEALQSVYKSQCLFAFFTAVEMIRAGILVEGAVFEHVVCGGEHGSGHGADGFFGSAPGAQSQILSLEIAVLLP